tara:strand:- start:363 stop:704 length:342 start_codon:yes stop_codon:yes gene_type:complete
MSLIEDDPYGYEKFKEKRNSLTSQSDAAYYKYSKIKINSVYQLDKVFHCETDCDKYFWIEVVNRIVLMSVAERLYDITNNTEVVLKYYGDAPTFNQVKEHMNWEIDEENIWID